MTRQANAPSEPIGPAPASDPAMLKPKPIFQAPGRKNSRKGGVAQGNAKTIARTPPRNSATADERGGRGSDAHHRKGAASLIDYGDHLSSEDQRTFVPEGEAEIHPIGENRPATDLRFADPLVQAIVEQWRQRQDVVKAQTRLTLQAKAICRRFTAGDKDDADKLYAAVAGKGGHPMAEAAAMAIMPMIDAQAPLIAHRDAKDKILAKLAKDLPIAHMVAEIRGVGLSTLAAIVGECGDLSAYRSVAAIWKRAGLAVIDGERQRLVAGNPEKAIMHGYSPARRSVFWSIGANLVRCGGKGGDASKYRLLYDEVKAREFAKLGHKGHSDNRARRYITKRLLRDLYAASKAAGRAKAELTPIEGAPAPSASQQNDGDA